MSGVVMFWVIAGICMFLIDILTSSFCFVLFSLGAVAAAICCILGGSFIIQLIVFCLINIISFIFGYPWLKKKYKVINKSVTFMEEKYIGKVMISDKEICNKAQVKVNGEYWTVINDGEAIVKGDKFIIIGVDGIKLKIKKI